jgi:hypothetical protein
VLVFAQHHRAHRVALQVQRQGEGVVRQFDHFALHHVGQAEDAHDAVGHADDRAFVACLRAELELLDAGLDQLADLGRIQSGAGHGRFLGLRR